MVNSHILLPRLLLKRFEDNKQVLHYIDVMDKDRVKRGHARSFYTEIGYYSDEVEHYLDTEIENPFQMFLRPLTI